MLNLFCVYQKFLDLDPGLIKHLTISYKVKLAALPCHLAFINTGEEQTYSTFKRLSPSYVQMEL